MTNIKNNDAFLVGTCNRWKKSERKKMAVLQPNLIKLYNQKMGGVDFFDKMRKRSLNRIRSRKWYWPMFRFYFNGSIINFWLLYRFVDSKMSLLEFTRQVVISLLAAPKVEKRSVAPKIKNRSWMSPDLMEKVIWLIKLRPKYDTLPVANVFIAMLDCTQMDAL